MADANTNLYQSITFYVSNAVPGQKIAVRVTANGASIAFSTGPAFQSVDGVAVTVQSGSLPLAQLNITSSQLTVLTTSSGGSSSTLNFQIAAYLVAEATIETFYLQSSSDPGVQVTVAIGNGMPQVVNQTQTLFGWYPN